MPWYSILFWGAVGAFLGHVSIFILPAIEEKIRDKNIHISLYWGGVRLIIYIICGALFAFIMGGATEPKHAAFYGLGWETGIRGIG